MERKVANFLTAEQKIAVLKEHLINKVPVSDLCDKYNIAPSVFFSWQKALFENGASILERKKSSSVESAKVKRAEERTQQLENKLNQKNDVIAELMHEHIELKKKWNGES